MNVTYNWIREAAQCMRFLCDETKIDSDNARGMVSYICNIIIKGIDDMIDKKGEQQ